MENYAKQTGEEKGVSALSWSSRSQMYTSPFYAVDTVLCLGCDSTIQTPLVWKGNNSPNALEGVWKLCLYASWWCYEGGLLSPMWDSRQHKFYSISILVNLFGLSDTGFKLTSDALKSQKRATSTRDSKLTGHSNSWSTLQQFYPKKVNNIKLWVAWSADRFGIAFGIAVAGVKCSHK